MSDYVPPHKRSDVEKDRLLFGKTLGNFVTTGEVPKKRVKKPIDRKEEQLQSAICKYMKLQYPKVIFHVDNGSAKKRGFAEQGVMSKQQYKLGYPDMQILHRTAHYGGLFLELKKDYDTLFTKKGKWRRGANNHFVCQHQFHVELNRAGYHACFVYNVGMAKCIIDMYLEGHRLVTDDPNWDIPEPIFTI